MPGQPLFFRVMLGLLLASGCDSGSGPPPPPSDGGSHDGATASDLGAGFDGAATDSGPTPMDGAAPVDGAPSDAGSPVDASDIDVGLDSGPISMPCTAMGSCNPFDPTSCPSGQSCRPDATGAASCQMLATTVHAAGGACTAGNDCAPGTLCLDFGSGQHCETMCPMGSIGFCSGENRCYGLLASMGSACIQICRPRPMPCNIYTQDCADTTESCAFATDPETHAPYTACRPTGTEMIGQPCGGTSGACARGLVCINETSALCHAVCGGDDGGTPTCATGTTCTGFARTWMVPYCR